MCQLQSINPLLLGRLLVLLFVKICITVIGSFTWLFGYVIVLRFSFGSFFLLFLLVVALAFIVLEVSSLSNPSVLAFGTYLIFVRCDSSSFDFFISGLLFLDIAFEITLRCLSIS